MNMDAHVILGINVDTRAWIKELKLQKNDNIIVIDYNYLGEMKKIKGVIYISTYEFKHYAKKFDKVNYYKSLYGFPGMSGKMADFFKENGDLEN